MSAVANILSRKEIVPSAAFSPLFISESGYFEYKPMFIEKIPIVANNNLKLDTVYRNNDNIICKLYSLNDDETSYIINKKFK